MIEIQIHNPNNLPLIDYRSVKPLQGNLKTLSDKNYQKLKNVLVKRGFRVPLFVWKEMLWDKSDSDPSNPDFENTEGYRYWLMDGHGRQKLMIQEDMQPYEVPYVLIEADTLKEAKAILLEVTSQYQTITKKGFEEFTGDLEAADFEDTVFDAFSFGTGEQPSVQEDEAPSVSQTAPISVPGEIYQLGRHRLLCGDATDFGAVSDLMNGAEADMVFTDPPYGVDYTGKTDLALKIENDKNTLAFKNALPNFITKSGAAFYVCCPAGNNFLDFAQAFNEHCYQSSTIIWVKNSLVMGHGDYHYRHEPILYGWNKEGSHQFYGDRSQTTVWEIDRPFKSSDHPTMKPVALVAKAITNSSKSGDIVLDLFGGSGTTLIACEQLDRTCYMAEIDPKYCDVIRKRYWRLVNKDDSGWEENTPRVND